ncbi:16S rRNA (uracil(1498)-N(3))-methyltransferase [Treponema primitia]|uniref:RsmE family RNA methyltransferase n=1 Tax=Treponema primitia TaxID=88058 RepID=UPI00397EBB49
MKQFILPSPPDSQGIVRLTGKDFHYLARVRRLKEGVVFNALLPAAEGNLSSEVRVLVQSVSDNCLTGQCLPAELSNRGSSGETSLPRIILFQALPKGAKLDLIVRQAAEGGIAEIHPFSSDYSIPQIEGTGRVERWRRIIKEARQQSGSSTATEIAPPCTVEALLDYWETVKKRALRPLGIILHQNPRDFAEPLAQSGFHGYLSINPDLVVLTIGPEGGFSPEEVSRFLAAGLKPLVIGNTVLRTETAALYAAAAVRIILLESTTWTLTTSHR